jgi:hypothetical protein
MVWQTDKYASHQPLLFWAVKNTTGPVLEIGVGPYSTPILHLICNDRMFVSLEGNPKHVEAYSRLQNENHRLLLVDNWAECKLLDMEWDVAFIGHAVSVVRKPAILRLKDRCKYIVAHDSECRLYGYEEAFAEFPYRVDCKWQNKWATIISMTEPLDDIEALLELHEPEQEEEVEIEVEAEAVEEEEVLHESVSEVSEDDARHDEDMRELDAREDFENRKFGYFKD